MSVVNQMLRDLEQKKHNNDLHLDFEQPDDIESGPSMGKKIIWSMVAFGLVTSIILGWNLTQSVSEEPDQTTAVIASDSSEKSQKDNNSEHIESAAKEIEPINNTMSKPATVATLDPEAPISSNDTSSTKNVDFSDEVKNELTVLTGPADSQPEKSSDRLAPAKSVSQLEPKQVQQEQQVVRKIQSVAKKVEDSAQKQPIKPTEFADSEVKKTSTEQQKSDRLYEAQNLVQQGLYTLAEKKSQMLLEQYPDFHLARENLATIYRLENKSEPLKLLLESAIQDYPYYTRYSILLAQSFAQNREWRRIIALFTQNEANASEQILITMTAIAYQQTQQHPQAIDLYAKNLRNSPERGEWWLGLGISLQAMNRSADALQAFEKASRDPRLSVQQKNYIEQTRSQLKGLL